MAFENLVSITFTQQELNTLDEALKNIENVLKGKMQNLTPEERRQYGSIAEQNKLFVNKVKMYMEQYPDYVPRYIDKAEFDRDYQARTDLEPRYSRLKSIMEQITDTKVLLDHDNYQASLSFYRSIRVLSQENIPGSNVIADDLKQFFHRGKNKSETEKNKEAE